MLLYLRSHPFLFRTTEIFAWRGISRKIIFSSQDNYFALIESEDLGVRIISMNQEFQTIGELEGNEGQFHSLTFSPDEQRIATVGFDRTIRLRDLRGRQLAQLDLNNPKIALILGRSLDMGDGFTPHVNFTQDGQWIVFRCREPRSRGSSPNFLWKVEGLEDLLMRGDQWSTDHWQDEIGLKIKRLLGSALS